jgi:hypothetical protein
MPVQTVIKTRRDTAANWLLTDPILAAGEAGLETDTSLVKYGDGTSAWSALAYSATSQSTYLVRNESGATIAKGTLVSAVDAEPSGRIDVAPFELTGLEGSELRVMGIAVSSISDGHNGTVMNFGTLRNLDTRGSVASGLAVGDETWAEGDILYAHPTADGKLTKIKPQHDLAVAFITVRHASAGQIAIRIVPGNNHLEWMHDVALESPADNEVLAYDSGSSLWKNQTPAEAGLATAANPTFTGTLNAAEVVISGDLTVSGTTTTVNAQDLVVSDPLIYIGEDNDSDVLDLGFVASFDNGTYQHTGLVRDASDDKWKLFTGVTDEPTTTVNFAQGSLDALAVGSIEATSATIGDVSNTELQYLNGVTSAVQTQLDGKVDESEYSAKGVILVGTGTGTFAAQGVGTNGQVLTANSALPDGVEWTTPATGGASTSGTLAQFAATTSSELAGVISDETGSGALVFGTSPALSFATLRSPKEITTVSATAATGTINYDQQTQADLFYTSNASANFTLNFRGSSSVTLNNSMATGDTATLVFRNTNGTTPYYANVIQIDGTTVTPKWLGGTAPSAGNASSIDVYSFVITKTGSATFTVLGSVSKFA